MIVQIVNFILACKIMYVLRSSDGKLQQHSCCRETDIDHVRHYEGSIKDAGFGQFEKYLSNVDLLRTPVYIVIRLKQFFRIRHGKV